jgi:hypothetical protein
MLRDSRFARVRQTKFSKTRSPVVGGQVVRCGAWKETAGQNFHHFVSRQFGDERPSDERSSAAQNADRKAVERRIAEQSLLGSTAGSTESVPLTEAELRSMEFLLDAPRQGQIEVVSSQEQVLANRDALKLNLLIDEANSNQAEVRCAAPNIADQNQVAILKFSPEP